MYYLSLSLIVLIIFAIASALITIYIDLEILYIFGIPMNFRMFVFGVFTILYGVMIIKLSSFIRNKRRENKE